MREAKDARARTGFKEGIAFDWETAHDATMRSCTSLRRGVESEPTVTTASPPP